MPADVARQFTRPGGNPPSSEGGATDQPLEQNNRERQAAGKPLLDLLFWNGSRALDLSDYVGRVVQVHLRANDIGRAARNTKKKHLWGSGHYTADTDLFAALVHQGLLPLKSMDQAYGWPAGTQHVGALLRVSPPQTKYKGDWRNGIRSRSWPNSCFSFSFAIERAWLVVQMV